MGLALASLVHGILVLLFHVSTSEGLIRVVYNNNCINQDLEALISQFGPSLHHEGLLGRVVEAKPANACHAIRAPPPSNKSFVGFIALIQRYDCPFTTKVLHAQQAGYLAAIVYNVNSQALVTMLSEEDNAQERIRIPSLFISESSSIQIRRIFHHDPSAYAILIPDCHWVPCQSNPTWSRQGHPTQHFSCFPTRSQFINGMHYLLFGLTLVIWIVALYVLCCL